MQKIFLINFPSFHELNFNRYFTFLKICGIQNPVNLIAFKFKNFLSGYTISFNVQFLKEKFPNSLFIYFKDKDQNVYNQLLFCRSTCLIDTFFIEDFKKNINLDLNNFNLENIKDKINEYDILINDIFKNNNNFLNLGEIDNFEQFILAEDKIKNFIYNYAENLENLTDDIKKSTKNKEIHFLDYLNFESQNFGLPKTYELNSLVSNFIFKIPITLNKSNLYSENLKKELEDVY
jgi:hypothetical protein